MLPKHREVIGPNFLNIAGWARGVHYSEITLRGIWGMALVLYADLSKFPEFFRIFGIFVVVTTAVLFFILRKWHAR